MAENHVSKERMDKVRRCFMVMFSGKYLDNEIVSIPMHQRSPIKQKNKANHQIHLIHFYVMIVS